VQQQAHFVTVATADLAAARRFYRDGLGWVPTLDVHGEIIFFQIGPGLVLGLFDADGFARDIDPGGRVDTAPAGFTLSHNVATPQDVDRLLSEAQSAGGRILKPGQRADFGGYHGHFADPNGILWEVACNPGWRVDPDGTVVLGPVDPQLLEPDATPQG
jgi:uncharacterized protein